VLGRCAMVLAYCMIRLALDQPQTLVSTLKSGVPGAWNKSRPEISRGSERRISNVDLGNTDSMQYPSLSVSSSASAVASPSLSPTTTFLTPSVLGNSSAKSVSRQFSFCWTSSNLH
jgi:hypothetical protein